MNFYKFVFRDGAINYSTGRSIFEAFSNAGFSAGDVIALRCCEVYEVVSKEVFHAAHK